MTRTEMALLAVERTTEHELRRLLQRMAVTDSGAVIAGVERMNAFDAITRDGGRWANRYSGNDAEVVRRISEEA